MIARITKVTVRHYSDNEQTKVYVEWVDARGRAGRTEGPLNLGAHMTALLQRAKREFVPMALEVW